MISFLIAALCAEHRGKQVDPYLDRTKGWISFPNALYILQGKRRDLLSCVLFLGNTMESIENSFCVSWIYKISPFKFKTIKLWAWLCPQNTCKWRAFGVSSFIASQCQKYQWQSQQFEPSLVTTAISPQVSPSSNNRKPFVFLFSVRGSQPPFLPAQRGED